MDFFGFQEQANRSTRRLGILLVLAVAAIILSLNVAIVLLFVPPRSYEGHRALYVVSLFANFGISRRPGVGMSEWVLNRNWWDPTLFSTVAGMTIMLAGPRNSSQFGRPPQTVKQGALATPAK